ncbi:pilus assembly protein PilP [Neisseriaceae bacterium JH1-16]|nr:pilus assembly protein PilP [Neisseriaceae bacterium JH1-16]
MKRRLLIVLLAAAMVLLGCGRRDAAELDEWMRQASRGQRSRIAPLPASRAAPALPMPDEALSSPFDPQKLWRLPRQGRAPDLLRPREPLEHYPLDQLRIVGTLSDGTTRYALVRTPEGGIYPVRVGHHLGPHFGRIEAIAEDGITLNETVADPDGNWVQRRTALPFDAALGSP